MEKTFTLQTHKVENPAMPDRASIGHLQTKLKVNCFTEFAPLKGVVMGYMGNTAQIPGNDPLLLEFFGPYPAQKYPEALIKRCQVAQDTVSQRLMDMGIEVLRPAEIDHHKHYELEGKNIEGGLHTFSPRDILFYYHDSVYECPTVESTRVHETDSMDWFLDQQRALGAKWYDSYKMYYEKNKPLFDAANLQKVGLDICFLISCSGKIEGYEMFASFLKKRYGNKVRVHPLIDMYQGLHLDVTFMPLGFNKVLGKNLVVVNQVHCNPTNLPALFRGKNWMCIEVDVSQLIDNGFEPGFDFASIWLAQNILMMSPELVMIDENQKPLMEMFDVYGIKSFPVPLEMMGSTLGGCHCMTNDYCREEDRDWGKILDTPEADLTLEERAGYFDPELLVDLEKYDIKEWTKICNEKKIFPTYATLHLDEAGKAKLMERHNKQIAELK
jgi:hypothetical protein